jgi:hypothetical protein
VGRPRNTLRGAVVKLMAVPRENDTHDAERPRARPGSLCGESPQGCAPGIAGRSEPTAPTSRPRPASSLRRGRHARVHHAGRGRPLCAAGCCPHAGAARGESGGRRSHRSFPARPRNAFRAAVCGKGARPPCASADVSAQRTARRSKRPSRACVARSAVRRRPVPCQACDGAPMIDDQRSPGPPSALLRWAGTCCRRRRHDGLATVRLATGLGDRRTDRTRAQCGGVPGARRDAGSVLAEHTSRCLSSEASALS